MSEPTMLDRPHFGHFLASINERDVDLLLMEEFHANDAFVEWFCSQLGINGARGDGAWHSVADVDGESDMILRVVEAGRHIGIFIENKIAAREMDTQAERYHIRAA